MAQTHFPAPVEMDSTLYVKDSVTMEKNLTIEQDIKVKGSGTYTGLLKAKDELKVLGTTKMKGDAFVEGTFKFKGLADPSAVSGRMLSINSNGKVKLFTRDDLLSKSLSGDCFQLTDGTGSAVTAPTWSSTAGANAGILYTGVTCPARVGIGTSNPLFALDVRGNGIFQSSLGVGVDYVFTDVQLLVKSSNQVGLCIDQDYTSNWGYGLKIVADQNSTKAIGIFNPTLNADVFRVMEDGKLWATEVNVYHEGDFPDYVFDADYDLMDLSEVEQFIAANGHLPNIPTAEEVAQDGINVGELQSKQMEKIEELTLYLIEMNKQLEELKKRNAELAAEIKDLQSNQEGIK